MTRIKNSTFTGVSVYDMDIDSPSFRRSVEDVAGDVALIYDKLTGENAEANTITHAGGGRGAPLRMPLVNQYIGRDIWVTNPTTKDTSGGDGDTMVLPYILRTPVGVTKLAVSVWMEIDASILNEAQPRVVVTDTSLAEIDSAPMTWQLDGAVGSRPNGSSLHRLTARVTGLTGGSYIVLSVRMQTDLITGIGSDIPLGRLISCSIFVPHRLSDTRSTALEVNETNEYGVTTPGSSVGIAFTDMHQEYFVGANIGDAIDGYTMSRLNRNLNGLLEYTTGFPAGGNATYTHEDQTAGVADSIDPKRSRFFAHTREPYSSEPECEFPVWAESFGAFLAAGKFAVNLAEPPTRGMLSWYAPWPITTSTFYLRKVPIVFPDFPDGGSSKLKVLILFGSEAAASVGSWTARAQTSAGSATATPVACDASNTLWLATISAVPFEADVSAHVEVGTSKGSAKTGIGEICVLAACAVFVP